MKTITTTSSIKNMTISSWKLDENDEKAQETKSISQEKKDIPCCFLAITDEGRPMFQWRMAMDRQQSSLNSMLLKMIIEQHLDISGNLIIQTHVYQDYSMILAKDDDLTFCYIFKGSSRSAKKRITHLLKKIKENEALWKGLLKNVHRNTMLGRWEIALLRKVTTRVLSNN